MGVWCHPYMELWEGQAAGATCERGFPERRRLRCVKERQRHDGGGDAAAAAAAVILVQSCQHLMLTDSSEVDPAMPCVACGEGD